MMHSLTAVQSSAYAFAGNSACDVMLLIPYIFGLYYARVLGYLINHINLTLNYRYANLYVTSQANPSDFMNPTWN